MEKIYEELYRKAWDHWLAYWKSGGVSSQVEINITERIGEKDHWVIDTVVAIRGKRLLVHKVDFAGSAEHAWRFALDDILRAGSAKLYQSTIELYRKHWMTEPSDQKDPNYLYPMSIDEAHG